MHLVFAFVAFVGSVAFVAFVGSVSTSGSVTGFGVSLILYKFFIGNYLL